MFFEGRVSSSIFLSRHFVVPYMRDVNEDDEPPAGGEKRAGEAFAANSVSLASITQTSDTLHETENLSMRNRNE